MYCVKCGNELNNQSICTKCGFQVNNSVNGHDDHFSIGFFLLGLCIPIVGLILFISWNKEKPRKAKAAGLGVLFAIPATFIAMGIIAAFMIPAVGTIIENTQKDVILADAIAVENASRLYCSANTCDNGDLIYWNEISPYIDNFDESYYDLENNDGIVAVIVNDRYTIYLEADGIGNYEFEHGLVPSESNRDSIITDTD